MKVKWTAIDVRIGADDSVRTLVPVTYMFEGGLSITVPAGFPCDLASVPRMVTWLLPSKLASAPFALLHDYLYAYAEDAERAVRAIGPRFSAYTIPRWLADELARVVADNDPDTSHWDKIYWAGVRIGGQRAWDRHRAARAKEKQQ